MVICVGAGEGGSAWTWSPPSAAAELDPWGSSARGCLLLGPPPEPTAEKSPDLGEGKLALGAKVFEEAGQRAGPSSTPAKVGDNSDLDGRVGQGFLKHS